ncbi:MAG: hydantoinase/oxoprolinase family protein [Pseudomonadota bacterium]
MAADQDLRMAVDIGGTFVDAVELDMTTGAFRLAKAPTTPGEPWRGVSDAIAKLATDLARLEVFIHGTTLGLNAVLERRGAVTGIITNDGFRDIFLIGRGNVPDDHMYDFQYEPPEPLVKRRRIAGVGCRLDYKGRELEPLDENGVRAAARHLVEEQGVEAIAICFLFSFRDPAHEQRAAEIIRAQYPEVKVSISSDIAREHREYERTSTTVLDAYIRPIFERYIDRLSEALSDGGFAGRFLVMRSGGGAMTTAAAKASPTQTVLSGPAGGIIGAAFMADLLDRHDLISFDVGGTSLDVCLIENAQPVTAHEAELEHYPLLIPTYDIRTIGAGGGSIAWTDEGLLKVGPQSAGAEPGPICYGRGGERPTVTDAALILGYVDPDRFLEGQMTLDVAAARSGIERWIGAELGMNVEAAAAGIYDVLLARTVGAARQVTVERSRDPATFSLLAFGGAGPLLAPLVARDMGIREVIVPIVPSGFSAWGMLGADIVNDYARTDLRLLDDVSADDLESLFAAMEADARASLTDQGIGADNAATERQLELRYMGQEHALTVAVGSAIDRAALRQVFEELHEARYGHAMEAPVQILNVRVRGLGIGRSPTVAEVERADGGPERALINQRPAYCFARRAMTPFAVYDRARLAPDDRIDGPAMVDEGTSVTVIQSDQRLEVNRYGHLLVTAAERA